MDDLDVIRLAIEENIPPQDNTGGYWGKGDKSRKWGCAGRVRAAQLDVACKRKLNGRNDGHPARVGGRSILPLSLGFGRD